MSVSKGPIDNKSALVQVMGWRRAGREPLPKLMLTQSNAVYMPGLILCLRPANERRRHKVTPSPIGWAQT